MPEADLVGVVLDGRYRVIEPIGHGAMGIVYRGERVKLGRAVAIKVLHDELPHELAGRKRFELEARAMAQLEHPHCVAVLDVGLHEGRPYVVMDFASGTDLRKLLGDIGRLEPERAVGLVRQVLSGLAHAHELGIVHRDIKPANLMVGHKTGIGDQLKILDFGLARSLDSDAKKVTKGMVLGTPSYMAPEQIRGAAVDARTDLYAVGVLLFELLTGKKPFESAADDPVEVVGKHLHDPPPRLADIVPDVKWGALEEVVARALAKTPEGRYANAAELSAALEAAIARNEETVPFEPMRLDELTRTPAEATTSPLRPQPSQQPVGPEPVPAPAPVAMPQPAAVPVAQVPASSLSAPVALSPVPTLSPPRGRTPSQAPDGAAPLLPKPRPTPTPLPRPKPSRSAPPPLPASPATGLPLPVAVAAAAAASAPASAAAAASASAAAPAAASASAPGAASAAEAAADVAATDPLLPVVPVGPEVPQPPILPPAVVSGEFVAARPSQRAMADPTERVAPLAPPKRPSSTALPISVSLPPHARADEPLVVQQRRLHIAAGVIAGSIILAVILRACAGSGTPAAPAHRDAGTPELVATAPSDAAVAAAPRDAALAAVPPTDAAAPMPDDPAGAALVRAAELVTANDVDGALRVLADAHKAFVANPDIPYMTGRLQLGKARYADAVASFHAAIHLFSGYQDDPELAKLVVTAFMATPQRHAELARFLHDDLGHAAIPALTAARDAAATPALRARAAAELKRLK